MRRRLAPCPNGFTLLEMLVALAVFSVAALTLVNLQRVVLADTATLGDRTIGRIVAQNVAAEALALPEPPARGTETGEEENAARVWRWVRETGESPEPGVLRIDIAVTDAQETPVARLTVYRPGRI
ncbi:MAG: type II secretion system minor pseudopilin GspI [Parasphingopyxis sp.]